MTSSAASLSGRSLPPYQPYTANTSVPINVLPHDCMREIFGRLSLKEALTARLVCGTWWAQITSCYPQLAPLLHTDPQEGKVLQEILSQPVRAHLQLHGNIPLEDLKLATLNTILARHRQALMDCWKTRPWTPEEKETLVMLCNNQRRGKQPFTLEMWEKIASALHHPAQSCQATWKALNHRAYEFWNKEEDTKLRQFCARVLQQKSGIFNRDWKVIAQQLCRSPRACHQQAILLNLMPQSDFS